MVEDHRGGPVTKIAASALDHRPSWDAMHAVTLDQLEEISQPMLCAWSRCVLGGPDMANSPPSSIPITRRRRSPQRGKAKQKRSDLRLADLGLVVNRDGGIPLTWHASP